ncbi:MAG: hypothetical protein LBG95_01145 [Treponema sp.]|jgi:hypothetical protein|nr:hypothetical protein [Treponema sp.]
MDDRKKQINELEQRKREQIVSLDALLARLGETLLGRVTGSAQENDSSFEELAVYKRLKNDIADAETAIQAVEEQIRRFRELEESIEAKEQEDSIGVKELAVVYGRLGKLLLDAASNAVGFAEEEGGTYAHFCSPYREQADALLTKVLSLEERLAGLEGKEGGNVFTWVGKSAQSLVLRTFLTKAQENLEQLRRNVGERYSRQEKAVLPGGETGNSGSESAEIVTLYAEIERKRAEARALAQDLAELREERRSISGIMNAEGGPLKQIQTLKKHIANARDELKTLYRRVGASAASIGGAERRQIVDSLIMPDDKETLDDAARVSRLIHDDETAIEKLQASLDIDEEKERIDNYRKMILDKKDRIAQAEKSIMKFEENIKVSEANIARLEKLL